MRTIQGFLRNEQLPLLRPSMLREEWRERGHLYSGWRVSLLLTSARAWGQRLASALSGSWRAGDVTGGVTVDHALGELMLRSGSGGLGFRVAKKDVSHRQSLDRLHDAYRWAALSARQHELSLSRAFQALAGAGIDAITGKGWAVARHYPTPGLRPYGDIDLYVTGHDMARASAVLARESGIPFDLHHGYADLDDRDPAEIRRRSVVERVNGTGVRLFGAEDHLRLLCAHAIRHGLLRPLWLCDIGLFLEMLPLDFDFAYFAAGNTHRTEAVFRTIGLANVLLGARLDRLPIEPERVNPPAWMVRATLGEWGRGRTAQGARTPFAKELFRPWRWPQAVLLRWPNAVEAAYETGSSFDRGDRVYVRAAACVKRIRRFAGALRAAPASGPSIA